MSKLKVAVTGATGFVGTNILNNLLKRNDIEIVACKRFIKR
jgi:nucleoside-diphosphate-sugar epimerase